jgi:(p)ppGpp synthase/HD superfamily hydrolase
MPRDVTLPDDPGTDSHHTTLKLGPRFGRAVVWAARRHDGQCRKGSDTPYVAHLLDVAALVVADGGSQRQAIAALLHDVLEDTHTSKQAVRRRFGRKVARIVDECTERPHHHTGNNWHRRKVGMLRRLDDPDTSRAVVRIKAADALANARSTVTDLRRSGPEIWQRFHAGAVDQLWYYRSVSVIVSRRLPGSLADELRTTVHELERLAGWWFDVGDPQNGK